MWMLQLLTIGSWLLKTTVCHQSELKGKTWVTVLACVGGNKLVTDMNYYEKPKEINSDINQMFTRFKWYCREKDWV